MIGFLRNWLGNAAGAVLAFTDSFGDRSEDNACPNERVGLKRERIAAINQDLLDTTRAGNPPRKGDSSDCRPHNPILQTDAGALSLLLITPGATNTPAIIGIPAAGVAVFLV